MVGDSVSGRIVGLSDYGRIIVFDIATNRQATPGLEQEIQQIVGSIRFG